MDERHTADTILEGRDIFEWADLAGELAFVLRDLVTDEEIGLHETGELWLRAKRAVERFDAPIQPPRSRGTPGSSVPRPR